MKTTVVLSLKFKTWKKYEKQRYHEIVKHHLLSTYLDSYNNIHFVFLFKFPIISYISWDSLILINLHITI